MFENNLSYFFHNFDCNFEVGNHFFFVKFSRHQVPATKFFSTVMLCAICDNHLFNNSDSVCGCSVCHKCTILCSCCLDTSCLECSKECDLCHELVCQSCVYVADSCKCCDQFLNIEQQGLLCFKCMVYHGMSDNKEEGFWCTACEQHCTLEKCTVCNVKDSQTECPICWSTLDNYNYTLQLCEIHKVCKECNYDTNLGCPLCRVGK